MENVQNRILNGSINDTYYTSVRLCSNSFLIIYTEPAGNINLFVLHSDGQTYSFDISGSDFEQLNNPYILYDLEDKCKNIDKNRYPNQDITKQIIKQVIDDFER